ncbi:MAG TPA: adenylate/guanylate cyclase domain-containing protein [Burkholderiaceae bacterium]|nr:adenylate/guanylate cyclase domain-containing protein [Burkholderiaceae bacterium]
MTVLFCDVADSTQMSERLGAERMHGVLNAFFDMALENVHRLEGTVNQFLGDGFMALFGAPIAHEDHARRAVLTALAIRDQIGSRSAEFGLPQGFQIRMGLNTGLVVVGKIGDNLRMDYTAIGDTTNTASRLQGAAQPGSIVIGEEVRRHVRNFVDLKALKPRVLKGKAEPVALYEVLKAHAAQHPSSARDGTLIGREAELTAIEELLERLAQGQGSILTITGEAGLGKSSLLAAARTLASARPLAWVEGGCVSYGKTLSYWPFREVLRSCFDIAEDDAEALSLTKLHAGLQPLFGLESDQMLAYLASVLGLPLPEPQAQQVDALDRLAVGDQVFRTTLRLFERLATNQPLAVALEDWHWADASSAELLEHLLALAAKVPILFVVAGRPDEQGAAASLMRALASNRLLDGLHRSLEVQPLPEGAARTLISSLLGGGSLPPLLQDRLTRQAEGNPFYLGELVRVLVSAQAIQRDPDSGTWQITEHSREVDLPDSIEGVILARVDRLADDAKQLLKTAAVIGRSFLYRVLRRVAENPALVETHIAQLKTADLVEDKRAVPELELMFKHPLIQQATYATMLEDRRRQLHDQVAQCIETLFAARLEEFFSVLAYHYAQAEHWERAQYFLLKAGDQAGRVAADAEALDHYERALVASTRSAHGLSRFERADLEIRMAEALYALGRNEAALQHAFTAFSAIGIRYPSTRRGVRLAVVLKAMARVTRPLWAPLRRLAVRGATSAPDPAHMLATRAIEVVGTIDINVDTERFALGVLRLAELADERPESREYVVSTAALGMVCDLLGLYRLAKSYHRRATRAGEHLGENLALGICCISRGMHEFCVGDWRAAERTLLAGEVHFRAAGHLRNFATVRATLILLHRTLGDPRWIAETEELLAIALEANAEQGVAWATHWIGNRHLDRGDYAVASTTFEDACAMYESLSDRRSLSAGLSLWALCLVELGDFDKALGLLERSRLLCIEYSLTGLWATLPLTYTAEAYLRAGELNPDTAGRARALALAKPACARATTQGRRVADGGAAEALRLNGVYAWLVRDRTRAQQLWKQGIATAEGMNAKLALARLHHELGTRTGDPAHLETARRLFAQMWHRHGPHEVADASCASAA